LPDDGMPIVADKELAPTTAEVIVNHPTQERASWIAGTGDADRQSGGIEGAVSSLYQTRRTWEHPTHAHRLIDQLVKSLVLDPVVSGRRWDDIAEAATLRAVERRDVKAALELIEASATRLASEVVDEGTELPGAQVVLDVVDTLNAVFDDTLYAVMRSIYPRCYQADFHGNEHSVVEEPAELLDRLVSRVIQTSDRTGAELVYELTDNSERPHDQIFGAVVALAFGDSDRVVGNITKLGDTPEQRHEQIEAFTHQQQEIEQRLAEAREVEEFAGEIGLDRMSTWRRLGIDPHDLSNTGAFIELLTEFAEYPEPDMTSTLGDTAAVPLKGLNSTTVPPASPAPDDGTEILDQLRSHLDGTGTVDPPQVPPVDGPEL
jgi:hypothetical protein